MLRRWPIFIATLYGMGGVAAWLQFVSGGTDLGNLGLKLYVLPASLVCTFFARLAGAADFPPPGSVSLNAIFFFPSLALLSYVVGWRGPAVFRKLMQ